MIMGIGSTTHNTVEKVMQQIGGHKEGLGDISRKIASGTDVLTNEYLVQEGRLGHHNELFRRIATTETCLANNNLVESHMNATYSQLEQLIADVTTALAEAASFNSPSGPTMPIQQIMLSHLRATKDVLNSKYGNEYLFSGSQSDIAATSDFVYNTNITNDVVTNNYFTGSPHALISEISEDNYLTYSLTADEPAFQNIIAGLHKIISGAGGEQPNITQGQDILQKGLDELISLRAEHGNKLKHLETTNKNLVQSNIAALEEAGVYKADLAELRLEAVETELAIQHSLVVLLSMVKMNILEHM